MIGGNESFSPARAKLPNCSVEAPCPLQGPQWVRRKVEAGRGVMEKVLDPLDHYFPAVSCLQHPGTRPGPS